MKQLKFIPKSQTCSSQNSRREHGGSVSLGRRRRRRPLSVKTPHHLVLRSDFAYGRRSLLRHRPLIEKIIKKAQKRFAIRVYEKAIVSNHIHLVVRGSTRNDLQNFFRVVAGHIAQEILRQLPLSPCEKKNRGGAHHNGKESKNKTQAQDSQKRKTREKENKFWQTRIYSRIISWGREYFTVKKYVIQNSLEALGIIPYQPRKWTQAQINNPSRFTIQEGENTS